ncbi:MAG: serine/threonine-protein kinase RsbW [Blastocatellia bacterium]|jgi:serine/threonine-protein kinase RsbW|nr:serine/threonine-protein kinase RsbW [Blastocatellia bacterium]
MPSVTAETTRLLLPSRIESVEQAAAAAAEIAERSGLGPDAAYGVDMALREAVGNAVVHGNKKDESKEVTVVFTSSPGVLEIEISDQGQGFDPESVPDPTAGENVMKTSGRGIFFMRTFMDEVSWTRTPAGGTKVRLVKHS